tara:strand:+ start:1897 stop:2097 length:201 start_codon:yes stop_codon:yes gene_type:complete
MSTELIVEKWNEIKVIVESLEQDVAKNSGGNGSAGVRARRGLRLLKKASSDLVKLTLEVEKARKAN